MFNTFDEVAPEPIFWWQMAIDLMTAAGIVSEAHKVSMKAYFDSLPKEDGRMALTEEQKFHFSRLGVGKVFFFLAGLAFENKIKGILIARNPGLVANGEVSKSLGKHDLVKLFQLARIELSERERELADRLGETIVWAGRYPVPMLESKRVARFMPDLRGWVQPGTFLEKDEQIVYDLWAKVSETIADDPRCPKYSYYSAGPEEEAPPSAEPQQIPEGSV